MNTTKPDHGAALHMEHCPVCGQSVRIVLHAEGRQISSTVGTCSYVGVAEERLTAVLHRASATETLLTEWRAWAAAEFLVTYDRYYSGVVDTCDDALAALREEG